MISRGYKHDPEFMKLIESTKPVDEIDVHRFDAIVVAGGQGPMFTFETATTCTASSSSSTRPASSRRRCATAPRFSATRGSSNGEPLVNGKTVTGFANVEEDFADQAMWDAERCLETRT